MVAGEVPRRADVVVVGGGPGGYTAALRAAAAGRHTVLIERAQPGGVCLTEGCISSKILLEVAAAADFPRRAAAWGVDMTATVDLSRTAEHRRRIIDRLGSGVARLLDQAEVEVIRGEARFSSPDRLAVHHDGVEHWEFDAVVLATGSRARPLDTFPVDDPRVVDAAGALALTDLPERLVVIGAGVIGVELGGAFARLGSTVDLVEAGPRILPGFPPTVAAAVERRLEDRPVGLHFGVADATLTEAGVMVGDRVLPADRILVAVGRRPNSEGLGLDQTAVETSPGGHVRVDEQCRAAPNIFAVGDLTDGPALAHKAMAEAEVAVTTITGGTASFGDVVVPHVVYGDPEAVVVGTWSGRRSFRFPLRANGRAATLGHDEGFAEVIADEAGTVTGVHLVGPHVSELAGEAALAVEMAATVDDLALTVHPHPTVSESLVEAAFGLAGVPLHAGGSPPRGPVAPARGR